jgi:hypothetical protein
MHFLSSRRIPRYLRDAHLLSRKHVTEIDLRVSLTIPDRQQACRAAA